MNFIFDFKTLVCYKQTEQSTLKQGGNFVENLQKIKQGETAVKNPAPSYQTTQKSFDDGKNIFISDTNKAINEIENFLKKKYEENIRSGIPAHLIFEFQRLKENIEYSKKRAKYVSQIPFEFLNDYIMENQEMTDRIDAMAKKVFRINTALHNNTRTSS